MSVQTASTSVPSRLDGVYLKGLKTCLLAGETLQVTVFVTMATVVIILAIAALALLIAVTYPVDRLRWRVANGRWEYPHRIWHFPLMAYAWMPKRVLIWVEPK